MKRRVLVMGGLGYLGWSLGVGLAHTSDVDVILADNRSKLDWAKQVGAAGIRIDTPVSDRLAALKAASKGSVEFARVNADKYDELAALISVLNPQVIVNCAHQPSAPYSELSPQTAAFTLQHNVATHLNVLWTIKSLKRPVKYIELSSAGTLGEIDYVPPQKVPLAFEHAGAERHVSNAWLPMQANDVYHLSKAQNFLLSEMFASRFGLTITSVRQSVLFGLAAVDGELPLILLPPMFYDPIFGTVANRFVVQHVAGITPTVYGDGSQYTGLIPLNEAVAAIVRCCMTDGRAGELDVLHNQTCVLSVKELATLIEHGAAKNVAADRPLKRRLALSELGPRTQTAGEVATALETFKRMVAPLAGELHRESLDAVCGRKGY